MRRSLASRRRRGPLLPGASFGFLRPPRRHEEEQERFIERLREDATLRREYRTSLAIQLTVVGALLLAVIGLVVQAIVVLQRTRFAAAGRIGWTLPLLVAFLASLVARRFLRLWSDYRRIGED